MCYVLTFDEDSCWTTICCGVIGPQSSRLRTKLTDPALCWSLQTQSTCTLHSCPFHFHIVIKVQLTLCVFSVGIVGLLFRYMYNKISLIIHKCTQQHTCNFVIPITGQDGYSITECLSPSWVSCVTLKYIYHGQITNFKFIRYQFFIIIDWSEQLSFKLIFECATLFFCKTTTLHIFKRLHFSRFVVACSIILTLEIIGEDFTFRSLMLSKIEIKIKSLRIKSVLQYT